MDVVEAGELHNRLARRLKEYEQTVGHLPPIEVLNELRYALRASIELLGTQGEEAELTSKLMVRIEHALFCAYHDLVDGLVIEIPSVLDQLRLEFPVSAGQVAGSRFIEIMSHVKEARHIIATTRGDPQSRGCGYEVLYEEWFGKLLDDYAFLRQARVEIAIHYQQSNRAGWRRYWLTIPFTLVLGWLAARIWEWLGP